MLTNNYLVLLTGVGLNGVTGTEVTSILGNTHHAVTGNDSNLGLVAKGLGFAYLTTMWNYTTSETGFSNGIGFGTGTSQPTENDYNLETPIEASNFDIKASSIISAKSKKIVATYNLTNNSTEAVTISEYGYFADVRTSANSMLHIMLMHSLFDVPLTIQPGETKTAIVDISIG